MSIKKRLAALERAMGSEGYLMSRLDEGSLDKLPSCCNELLRRAIKQKFLAIRHKDAEELNVAIQALPKPDRDRVLGLARQSTIVAFSETDWRL
jgi:hypothetical protein